jgi:hypothetical protein
VLDLNVPGLSNGIVLSFVILIVNYANGTRNVTYDLKGCIVRAHARIFTMNPRK